MRLVEKLRDASKRRRERWKYALVECDDVDAAADHVASAPLCEKHQPNGGARSGCLVCALERLSSALSRIDYLCGEPNEMGISDYDCHYDEEAVVRRVEVRLSSHQECDEGGSGLHAGNGGIGGAWVK